MADSLRATTRQQAPTSGTTDHTIAGFGTPTAAIIISQIGGIDSDVAHFTESVGFWDGTNDVCASIGLQDAVAGSAPEESTVRTTHGVYHDIDSVGIRSATVTNITDGIRLTWNTDSSFQPYVTVILISANNAISGTFTTSGADLGTVTVTDPTFAPNFVIYACHYGTSADNQSSSAGLSVGFAADDSGITQRCVAYRDQDNAGTTASSSYAATTRSSFLLFGSSDACAYETTEMSDSQFTVKTYNLGIDQANPHAYLALNFDTPPVLFDAATPTSGNWDPYTDTAERQSYLFLTTANDTMDSVGNAGDEAGGIGWNFVSKQGDEFSGYITGEDAVTTRNNSGRVSTSMFIQGETAGTPLFVSGSPTFDSTGLVFTPTTYDATPRMVVGAAFGTAVSSDQYVPTLAQRIYRKSGRFMCMLLSLVLI